MIAGRFQLLGWTDLSLIDGIDEFLQSVL